MVSCLVSSIPRHVHACSNAARDNVLTVRFGKSSNPVVLNLMTLIFEDVYAWCLCEDQRKFSDACMFALSVQSWVLQRLVNSLPVGRPVYIPG